MLKLKLIFIVLASLALLATACGSDSNEDSISDNTTTTTTTAAPDTETTSSPTTEPEIETIIPQEIFGLNTTHVSAGRAYTCAVSNNAGSDSNSYGANSNNADGEVWCWGDTNAELGFIDADANYRNTPAKVLGIENAVQISAGSDHTCAVTENGEVWCWGAGDDGQLGDGEEYGGSAESTGTRSPVKVLDIENAVQVAVTSTRTCALLANSHVYCWGWGEYGQLGDGENLYEANTPVRVQGINAVTQISAGSGHTCGTLIGGEVYCWGYGDDGELGDGEEYETIFSDDTLVFESPNKPVRVIGINNAIHIAAGLDHTCAVTENGEVWCWGAGHSGQLGDGEEYGDSSNVPVKTINIDTAVNVAAGRWHTCAVTDNGEVWCWGAGHSGQLGDGEEYGDNQATGTPVKALNIDNALEVTVGESHTCAVTEGAEVWCWGAGFGNVPIKI